MIQPYLTKFRELGAAYKFYALGGVVFLGYFISSFFLSLVGYPNHVKDVASATAPVVLGALTVAVVIESAQLLEKLWENFWFKGLAALLTFISYTLARVHADGFINEFTSLDPAKLPQAQSLLTSLFLVPTWVSLLLWGLLVYMVVAMLILPFLTAKDRNDFDRGVRIGRLVGVLGALGALGWVDTQFKNEESLVNLMFKEAVLSAEYHGRSNCENVASDEYLVADIGRGYVSIFSKKSLTFHTGTCLQGDVVEGASGDT